ncbi:hypothetical protein V6C27_14695 [Peptococcaceae bacterium 1198_IL3148]
MSVQISDEKLFEFIVALVLRNNGYIAGVPRRLLGGRATKHQINVIGLDLNTSPFTFNNIIIIKSCFNQQGISDLDIVRNLKATIMDLEQTLPPKRELIRDIVGTDRGDLFHRIYGREKNRETFTVNYVGGMFISKTLNKHAWEYANAHGIYVTYLPQIWAGHSLEHWFKLLRQRLNHVVDKNGTITLPGLAKKEKKLQAFKEVIQLLQYADKANFMEPQQSHDLFTIINDVLTLPEFSPLQTKLQQLVLASINGYPVVLDHNLTYRSLLEAALISLNDKFGRAKSVSQRTKYRPLNTIKFIITEIKNTLDPNIALLSYCADTGNAPLAIQKMSGAIYAPVAILNSRISRFQLKLPLKNGISLICEFHLRPPKNNLTNLTSSNSS